MGLTISTFEFSPSSFSKDEQAKLRLLLPGVWRMDGDEDPVAYADQYTDLLSDLVDGQHFHQPTAEQTISLVQLVKDKSTKTIRSIKDDIRASNPSWILDVQSEESLSRALSFAVRLSLFTRASLGNDAATLSNCVAESLALIRQGQGTPASGSLSGDFCATNLGRIGGITIVRTGILQDHLQFQTDKRLSVFGHASALKRLSDVNAGASLLLPKDVLEETELTLRLLLKPNELGSASHNYRLAQKARVDLELGLNKAAPLDLKSYPIWGHRLAEVQKRYNAAVPELASQWWYDRRQKREWATFWVAFVVFVLTVIFGLISTAIGSLQVYAAFRAIPTGSSSAGSGEQKFKLA